MVCDGKVKDISCEPVRGCDRHWQMGRVCVRERFNVSVPMLAYSV